jgi:uncharacterized protein (TIGR03066 family)
MRIVWTAAVACLALALLGSAHAGDKKAVDKAKLVGVWEVSKGETLPAGGTIEFTKDGKLKIMLMAEGKTISADGTYTVDGDKVKTVTKFEGKEHAETIQVQMPTDNTLVTIDEKGKKDEFKRKAK